MYLQHSLDALTEHRDEGQDKHGILLAPHLELSLDRQLGVFLLEHFGDLDTPLILELAHTEQSGAHECDDDAGEDAEDTLPDVLSSLEGVATCCVESSDDSSANDQADEYTSADTVPDLHIMSGLLGLKERECLTWRTRRFRTAASCSGPRVCFKKARSTETIILVSKHSLKQIKNTTHMSVY